MTDPTVMTSEALAMIGRPAGTQRYLDEKRQFKGVKVLLLKHDAHLMRGRTAARLNGLHDWTMTSRAGKSVRPRILEDITWCAGGMDGERTGREMDLFGSQRSRVVIRLLR